MGPFPVVAAVLALSLPVAAQRPIESDDTCAFTTPYEVPAVTVKASPELAAMFRHWQPPHSPVAITAVDLSEADVIASPGAYSWRGPARVEVMNISDRTLSTVGIMVHIGWGAAGTGHGNMLRTPLRPGEHATIDIGSRGEGRGTDGSADLPTIHAYVSHVKAGDCVMTPPRRAFVK